MKNSFNVATWEIRKMLKNKSFIISILLTPIIIAVFAGLPTLLGRIEGEKPFTLYIIDEISIFQTIANHMENSRITTQRYDGSIGQLEETITGDSNTGYVHLTPDNVKTKHITVYIGGDGTPNLQAFYQITRDILQQRQLIAYNLNPATIEDIMTPYSFHTSSLTRQDADMWEKWVPAIFSGLILFLVFITGMMTLQSAIADKKDRMAEILLSSVSAKDLMQGKIIGYFVLGLMQGLAFLVYLVVVLHFIIKIPIGPLIQYLLVPELAILLFFALGGYLMFSALFVGLGATIDDLATAGNFQSMIFILPMLPLFLAAPIIIDPNGLIARVGSYFPLSVPGVMVLRIALSTTLTTMDILIPAVILVITVWLLMKLAGKIYKTGILMYGKNATPKEIWRWVKQ